MKSTLKKIILLTAALLFLGTGVSFAHDRSHKTPGHAYGHTKFKGHPAWHKKAPGLDGRHRNHYAPVVVKKYHRDSGHYRYIRCNNGSVVKLSIADQNVALKIVVKDHGRR